MHEIFQWTLELTTQPGLRTPESLERDLLQPLGDPQPCDGSWPTGEIISHVRLSM